MKKQTEIKKVYVPYGINGLYYIYDNEMNCLRPGHSHIYGSKKKIKTICDRMNTELQAEQTNN